MARALRWLALALSWLGLLGLAQGLGTAGKIAVSYGVNGQALCQIKEDGSQLTTCFGTDAASVSGAPSRHALSGITGGDGFVCGLSQLEQTPYCWGNNIYVPAGVPQMPDSSIKYVGISAGDNHLCALREGGASVNAEARKKSANASSSLGPWVDCWGYNMTGSFISQPLLALTAGSFFTCGLFASNRTAICWGDDSGYNVIQGVPDVAFSSIAAGGYHVCGIEEGSLARTICWGRTLAPPGGPPQGVFLNGLVGGKFHSCGLKADTLTPICWGLATPSLVPTPENESLQFMVAGDYFTCGVSGGSLRTVCWGSNYPLPSVAPPVPNTDLGCSKGGASCSPPTANSGHNGGTIQVPIIIGELVTAVVVISALLLGAYFWVRYKLAKVALKADDLDSKAPSNNTPPTTAPTTDASLPHHHQHHHAKKSSFRSSSNKTKGGSGRHEEPMNPRAHVFRYQELQEATGEFGADHEIGRGSFSIVYKGILASGTVVAVKRAMGSTTNPDKVPESKEFRNELDLLSRLNHAHLLNLLGYCEEGGERLLVYEYMANGTLFEHLHGEDKEQLNWVTRLKIAVQAARGLEYLHGYACHPVIHRDIKSCNILLDEEWNARVADFGLSLFGPENSNCPLSEPPAGTLGYLDPEYYRLHYLTTKSDIYSFGVLLLEIMSGRKAIDMGYPQGNIVEWAVPLIKAGLTRTILDNRIEDPPDLDALDKLAKVAAQCVRMRGKDRPSMEKVTTSLERALALMLGTPNSDGQLILPTEVVLGSARLNKKTSSRRSSSHKSESRKSDSEFGEPVRERDKDFVDVPAFGKLRGYHPSVEDLPRVSSLTRVQSFNKVHSLTRNQSLTRAYSFNKAYSQRTASSRLDEEDLEMQSFGSPPFETNNSLRAVDREAPRDIRIDSWPQHIRGPSSSVPCDSEISPESPRQL
ncbi:protein MpRLK-Pelle_CR4L5 [Marchantia polymorpha subsp. ruderalis]|uniref:non-specific serine/threonine protein kinase n=1 Tax=Marchantia polymorpha TaxID=3197 RepID=A0A2R6WRE4_MARPO|nr:hypothetical protein MARPO_0064s0097 [Marchantia polymorpha]BBN18250.1 hypothetical protein Mp_8g01000 [Marchantia polymorpha subsp. ruderalis]|eukprot:PTQ36422.1 hypothetical protein MARPO_0064s0097 [Marchantia polymorpha]